MIRLLKIKNIKQDPVFIKCNMYNEGNRYYIDFIDNIETLSSMIEINGYDCVWGKTDKGIEILESDYRMIMNE